jgi:hypothetical protein
VHSSTLRLARPGIVSGGRDWCRPRPDSTPARGRRGHRYLRCPCCRVPTRVHCPHDVDATWVWLFQSEAPAGGHAARLPAVPGPLTRRTGPAVPPATARRGPLTPATAPGPRPADARDMKLRSWQRPRRHIAVALARPPPSRGAAGRAPARSAHSGRAAPMPLLCCSRGSDMAWVRLFPGESRGDRFLASRVSRAARLSPGRAGSGRLRPAPAAAAGTGQRTRLRRRMRAMRHPRDDEAPGSRWPGRAFITTSAHSRKPHPCGIDVAGRVTGRGQRECCGDWGPGDDRNLHHLYRSPPAILLMELGMRYA